MTDDDIRALRDDAAKLRTFVGPWLGDGQHANVNGYALADRIARLLDEVERLREENDSLQSAYQEGAELVADLKAEVSAVAREAERLRAAPTPPVQQDDEALEVLQTIVSAYDKFKLARGYSDDRNEWILAARALIAKRGEK